MGNLTAGRDGKMYMAWRDPADRIRVIGLVHRLACSEGLSRRQVQRRLFDFHVRRSVGTISQYLSRYECDQCAKRPEVTGWR